MSTDSGRSLSIERSVDFTGRSDASSRARPGRQRPKAGARRPDALARVGARIRGEMVAFVLSAHAEVVVANRSIEREWLEQVLERPERVESDKVDPALKHAIGRISAILDACCAWCTTMPSIQGGSLRPISTER